MTVAAFYIFAAVTLVGAVGVFASRDIVRTAVFLLFSLLGVAGLYLTLAAEFLAAVQLVIYVGGTLVLIIFGVMLTARSGTHGYKIRPAEWATASATALLMLTSLIYSIIVEANRSAVVHEGLTLSDGHRRFAIEGIGRSFLGTHLLPFELASLLLLAVMIGAAYLARRPGGVDRTSAGSKPTAVDRATLSDRPGADRLLNIGKAEPVQQEPR